MSEEADIVEDELLKTDEKPKEETKAGRKLYLGRVVQAGMLEPEIKPEGTPIQPIRQRLPKKDSSWRLPPTFVATKFSPGFTPGHVRVDYFDPRSKTASSRELPHDFELNVLTGRRKGELQEEYENDKQENLHKYLPRLGCTLGADPEIFAVDADGQVMPAWTWLNAKSHPNTYDSGEVAGSVYPDGFQAEWNTPGNNTCAEVFSHAIFGGLRRLDKLARDKGGRLTIQNVFEINPDRLAIYHSENPKNVEFGCSPSKNVYGLSGNKRDGKDVPYRFAGGHIHLGLNDKREKEYIIPMVKDLDRVVGVAAVSMFATLDDPIRRQFYGLPGEYRTPAHGVEYRVLSNAWLCHPLAYHLVYDLVRVAGNMTASGQRDIWKAEEGEVIETILAHDVDRARAILKRNERVFRGLLRACGGQYTANPKPAEKAWTQGIESVIRDPKDIEGNWHLHELWQPAYHTHAYFHANIKAGYKV